MTKSRRALPWLNGGKGLILLLIVVLLSRVPFLGAGYGLHWDAWGNAKAARQIAETGHYVMARVPGASVYELTIALLSWGAWALNGSPRYAGLPAIRRFEYDVRGIDLAQHGH